ncbi:MAG: topoisomerase IV [Clostridiales bacterium GWF2_38_85]|nr:MAG: topoisomerase IV [Clostridiales bacterium GWF2_38_85]HBL84098.1 topoisomerase IV [Clostridiales bacterium]
MAKSKKTIEKSDITVKVDNQGITSFLETNYMPYTMSVIVSRAIPAIDGFKPSHRKLLYTMYKMGLLGSSRTKSANVVGQTMKLNPHGDASIYETMVRLTAGKEALLHPFVDSKGTFGKQYSDMAYAASRYTEVKLSKICEEIFTGIDKDSVDFVDNYDSTTKEPWLLPTSFPNVLVSPNIGIAVGMASNICSFNLAEVCDATIEFLKKPKMSEEELLDILIAPDFSTGGSILYDRKQLLEIYKTGRGSFKVRGKWRYDQKNNCIEIIEVPYTTTIEKIKSVIIDMVKSGKLKDISDVRDEIDIGGNKLTIDLKRSADYEKIIAKLLKGTSLEDDFGCNFNILTGGTPSTLGIIGILDEWTAFRVECLRREYMFDLGKKQEKLHLLKGLKKLLLDIDKAIKIIRNTENEVEVVPNLMKGFSIDEIQAEYVADIKLRNLNREYIINRISDIEGLEKDIDELNIVLSDDQKIKKIIQKQLTEIKKKYSKPRKTLLLDAENAVSVDIADEIEDYPVMIFVTAEGYFKKCTIQSLRGSDVQKVKDSDTVIYKQETTNRAEIMFFTTNAQVYKAKLDDFDQSKASALGDYIPAKLGFDADENLVSAISTFDYSEEVVLFFENGKAVAIPSEVYQTKTNRKKLTNAFFDNSRLIAAYRSNEAKEYLLLSKDNKALLINEKQINRKTTRTSSGSNIFTLKKNDVIIKATPYYDDSPKLEKESKYRKRNLPATGVIFEDYDINLTQQTLV